MKLYIFFSFLLLLTLTSCASSIGPKKSCEGVAKEARKSGIVLIKHGKNYDRVKKISSNICKASSVGNKQCTLTILGTNKIIPPISTKYGVILTDGLTKMIDSDDDLAFVIGHEISHISLGHNSESKDKCAMDGIKRLLSYPSTMSDHLNDYGGFGKNLDYATTPESYVGALWLYTFGSVVKHGLEEPLYNSYDHKKEYDADHESMRILKKAGYKVKSIYKFFERFERLLGDNYKRYRNTHPSYENRKKILKESLGKSNNI